jgi:hypothetical protein
MGNKRELNAHGLTPLKFPRARALRRTRKAWCRLFARNFGSLMRMGEGFARREGHVKVTSFGQKT